MAHRLLLAATLARGALLDPGALLQSQASQPTSLRPYLPLAENGGLECATLARSWLPEAELSALHGVMRTRVGYCGGTVAEPTYGRVCSDPEWADWVPAVQVEYDPSEVSYWRILDAVFGGHDGWGGERRQQQSTILAHTDAQAAVARQVVANRYGSTTAVEPFVVFWDAEACHQKRHLQRAPELFMSLGLREPSELLSSRAAAVLNAVAARKLRPELAERRLAAMEGEVSEEQLRSLVGAMAAFWGNWVVIHGG
jgi:peptide methionine sulfoxide reductase MsrA